MSTASAAVAGGDSRNLNVHSFRVAGVTDCLVGRTRRCRTLPGIARSAPDEPGEEARDGRALVLADGMLCHRSDVEPVWGRERFDVCARVRIPHARLEHHVCL